MSCQIWCSCTNLDGDCGASHKEDDDGGDDEDEHQHGDPQALLLVCRVELVADDLADADLSPKLISKND